MSTLVFFPWIAVEKPLRTGNLQLIPYERGRRPAALDTAIQAQIDQVLLPYRNEGGHPISEAVLLQIHDRPLTSAIDEETGQTLFAIAELLAFAGLSNRDFFGVRYCNRDNFQIVVQGFRPESNTVVVPSRRRDGATHVVYPQGTYRVLRPAHVPRFRIDERELAILSSLMKARLHPDWDRMHEAITNFNLANTDNPAFPLPTEAILAIGAFQRLLNCDTGREDQLAERFSRVFQPRESLSPSDCGVESPNSKVTDAFRRRPTIREGWIRDFYALRGQYAHGTIATRYPSIWTAREHLLLAAFAFPLLLKKLLADGDLYALTDEDVAHISAFEHLACTRHFVSTEDFPDQNIFPWPKIISSARIRESVERFFRSDDSSDGPDSPS